MKAPFDKTVNPDNVDEQDTLFVQDDFSDPIFLREAICLHADGTIQFNGWDA